MIKVLTYNVPHRKTQDLLFRLKLRGYDNVQVFATPWVDRKIFSPLIPHRNFKEQNFLPKEVCQSLNYEFNLCESLNEINQSDESDLILIGGAGIINKEIIDKFTIVNSHPAFLPYVRGLDSLKWAIYFNKPIGVTSHVISEETDAGFLIKRELVPIYKWDTFHSISLRQYEMEMDFLADSIVDLKSTSLEPLSIIESEPMRRIPHQKEKELLTKVENIKSNLE